MHATRALLSLVALLPAVAASQTTRTERGDTVVITTTRPARATTPLRPVELLRIGGDSHETTFGQVSLLAAMPDGALLGEVDFPPRVRVLQGHDHVRVVIPDADDVPVVVKYRVPGVH